MLIPSVSFLVLFHLFPLWGISLAFVDYNPFLGLRHSTFVGLQVFRELASERVIWEVVRNTLLIALGKLVLGQLASLVFALMLSEIAFTRLRRVVQTVTTFPHFLSWVIIAGMMITILSSSGPVNTLLQAFGLPGVGFLRSTGVFPLTLIGSEVWKEFGFGAVIYLAALLQINPDLYEAAAIDGAGRWRRLTHVTIPSIGPIIVLLACLSLGNVLNAGFEQVLVLYNPLVFSTGDIIDTWVYREGLLSAQYSLGTAVGLLKGAVGFALLLVSYWMAGRFAKYRIW